MSRRRADWVSVQQARAAVLAAVPRLDTEIHPLGKALGRVLAEDVVSPVALPPWDNSAMDGFAVREEDVRGATQAAPRVLSVIDEVSAGGFASHSVEPGTAIRIMTGAPVPAGADSVVRVEHTDGGGRAGAADAQVVIFSDEDAGRNIRPRGEDVEVGRVVIRAGRVLGAAEIGLAASVGYASLPTVRRPRVAVLATGNELVELDDFDQVREGRRIVSSNSYTLAAQVRECGCEVMALGLARDTPESIRDGLDRAAGCDVVITSAGVSVGEHDHVKTVLDEMGVEGSFWRVAMRPGSPFAFGRVAALGSIPWFGLPGNPVSSMVTFELLVRPALLTMAGHTITSRPVRQARLLDDFDGPEHLTHFLRVTLQETAPGELEARLTGPQGSGILSSMAAADALLEIPAGPRTPGALHAAILLRDF